MVQMPKSLMKQTFLLMLAGLMARFLGLVYQTMLSRTIGPQGLGLYQMTFTIYMSALTLASAGLSQSISKLTSEFLAKEDYLNAKKNFRISLTLVLITSTAISFVIYILAPNLASFIYKDTRLVLPFRFLTIAILSVAISQVFQGYFQGQKNMLPTASSQIMEQVIRIVSVPLIIVPLLRRGVVAATTGAIIGMGIAEFTGLLILIIFFMFKKTYTEKSFNKSISNNLLLKRLLFLALPIGFGSLISTVNYSLSTIIIPRAMAFSGASREMAVEALGYFSGMAMPLLFFPTVFTFPIALSLIPGVSEAMAMGDTTLIKKRIGFATKFTVVLGLFVTLLLRLFSGQLPFLIFGYSNVSYIVKILAFGAIFLYPQQIFTSILQGLGRPGLALRNLAIFTFANLILLVLLVSRYGIIGAAYTFILVNLLAFIVDFLTIRSIIYVKFDFLNWVLKPSIALYTTYRVISALLNISSFNLITTITNITITILLSVITIILSTAFNKDEIINILKILKK